MPIADPLAVVLRASPGSCGVARASFHCHVRPPVPAPGRVGRCLACNRTLPARLGQQKLSCGPHGAAMARLEAGHFRPILRSTRQRTPGRTLVLESRHKRHVASLDTPAANAAGLASMAGP